MAKSRSLDPPMSDLLERPKEDVKVTNDGDHDRFQHYFHKKDIERNIFEGVPMRALCGKVVAQQVDPQGRTICSECQDIYDNVVGSNRTSGG